MLDISDKAQEIAYALIRVAAYIRRRELRNRFEWLSLNLVEQSAVKNAEESLNTAESIKNLVKLGAQIYEVETVNARILINELEDFESAIRQNYGLEQLSNLQSLFTKSANAAIAVENMVAESANAAISGNGNSAIGKYNDVAEEESEDYESRGNLSDESGMVSIGTTIRQSAILEKVRSMSVKDGSGNQQNCRMKDLIAAFPDVSERTIRNDIQRLLNQGMIERIGGGGPASAYVIK